MLSIDTGVPLLIAILSMGLKFIYKIFESMRYRGLIILLSHPISGVNNSILLKMRNECDTCERKREKERE